MMTGFWLIPVFGVAHGKFVLLAAVVTLRFCPSKSWSEFRNNWNNRKINYHNSVETTALVPFDLSCTRFGKLSQSFPKFPKVSQSFPKFGNVSQNFRKLLKFPGHWHGPVVPGNCIWCSNRHGVSATNVDGMPCIELVPKVDTFEAQCYWQPFRAVGIPSSRTSTQLWTAFNWLQFSASGQIDANCTEIGTKHNTKSRKGTTLGKATDGSVSWTCTHDVLFLNKNEKKPKCQEYVFEIKRSNTIKTIKCSAAHCTFTKDVMHAHARFQTFMQLPNNYWVNPTI